jgi:hypothetical protein
LQVLNYKEHPQGLKRMPKTNMEYINALILMGGKEFGADLEFQWSCNPERPIRVDDAVNGTQVLDGKDGRQEQKGCGSRYYQNDVPKQPNEQTGAMEYPVRVQCSKCGANLRAFAQIARFRA